MNANTLFRENTARAVDVVKAVETTAGAIAGTLEKKSDQLATAFENKAGPVAQAVEVKAEILGEALEEKLERVRRDALEGLKGFKFGQREAILLGIVVGVLAVAAISRRIDRQAAAERLRAAGSRVGGTAQELGSRVGVATAELTSKAGELAGQVKEEVSTRAGVIVEQLRPSNGHGPALDAEVEATDAEKGDDLELDAARQRLSAEALDQPESDSEPARENAAANPDAEAGTETPVAAAPAQAAEAAEAKVSNGMKVVAFDGTDIGRVQETREDVFVLDRPKGADLLVPLDQVARIEGTVVYLRIEMGQLTKMGWEKA